jgi:hypothetical protein
MKTSEVETLLECIPLSTVPHKVKLQSAGGTKVSTSKSKKGVSPWQTLHVPTVTSSLMNQ